MSFYYDRSRISGYDHANSICGCGSCFISYTLSLGNVLYTDYMDLFQLSGMILLVAMIGAIVLTFRQREGLKRQSYIKQISREKKDGIEIVDVQSKRGVKIDV